MTKIKFSGKFNKMYRELINEEPALSDLIADAMSLFEKNPDDTRLDNHALTKKMKGQHAFSITNDVRIIYKRIGKNTVRFLAIGPHKKVYKN